MMFLVRREVKFPPFFLKFTIQKTKILANITRSLTYWTSCNVEG